MANLKEEEFNPADFSAEQLALMEADAAEADGGYSAEFLRSCRRLPGRPRELGDEPGVMVRFRMAPDRLAGVDERASRLHMSRSQYLRDLVDRDLADA